MSCGNSEWSTREKYSRCRKLYINRKWLGLMLECIEVIEESPLKWEVSSYMTSCYPKCQTVTTQTKTDCR
jgi:hypothetical protein